MRVNDRARAFVARQRISVLLLEYFLLFWAFATVFALVYWKLGWTNSPDLWPNIYFSAANQTTIGGTFISLQRIPAAQITAISQIVLFGGISGVFVALVVFKLTIHSNKIEFAAVVGYDKYKHRFSYRFYFPFDTGFVDITCKLFVRRQLSPGTDNAKRRMVYQVDQDLDDEPLIEKGAPILVHTLPGNLKVGPDDLKTTTHNLLSLSHLKPDDELVVIVSGRRSDSAEQVVQARIYRVSEDFRCGTFSDIEVEYIHHGRSRPSDIKYERLDEVDRHETDPCRECQYKDAAMAAGRITDERQCLLHKSLEQVIKLS